MHCGCATVLSHNIQIAGCSSCMACCILAVRLPTVAGQWPIGSVTNGYTGSRHGCESQTIQQDELFDPYSFAMMEAYLLPRCQDPSQAS